MLWYCDVYMQCNTMCCEQYNNSCNILCCHLHVFCAMCTMPVALCRFLLCAKPPNKHHCSRKPIANCYDIRLYICMKADLDKYPSLSSSAKLRARQLLHRRTGSTFPHPFVKVAIFSSLMNGSSRNYSIYEEQQQKLISW